MLLRGRVLDRDRAHVRDIVRAGAFRVPLAPPLRGPANRAVFVSSKKPVYLHRASDSSIRSESPPTLRLASPVTAMFEMVTAPLHVGLEAGDRRELLHPGARQPGGRRRGLVPALDCDAGRAATRPYGDPTSRRHMRTSQPPSGTARAGMPARAKSNRSLCRGRSFSPCCARPG